MNDMQELNIKENIEKVKARIQQAAKRSGRDDRDISLVAVTKQKPAAVIKELVENGIRKIGESYLQEAVFKIDLLEKYEIEWHMIGNIQRGKEKHVASRFQIVHSVGSLKTARELSRYAAAINKNLSIYLELNVSGESTKLGWQVKGEKSLAKLLPEFEEILDLPALSVLGLMTMAPYSIKPEDARPYFRRMREIRDYLSSTLTGSGILDLSMGMSGDFEVAIEEGATVVRIGSALVGPR
ncbi:MAG: YggS family pyridoxal phosphate-dependent enzyme [Chloroflexota bacterium]|nr:MAG: YggS family pyridoxal phosphate-dependent enzyme [Chloroflexota bacterium]